MDELELKAIASQLSCPEGDAGIEMANKMNVLNLFITARAIEVLSPQADEAIVEIGPGNGALSEPMLDTLGAKGRYYGIELSEHMAKEARQRFSKKDCHVDLLFSDCLQAAIPEKSVDGIMAVNLLYFIENLDELFSKLQSWMKPGARVVFGVRSDNSLNSLPFVQYKFNVRSPDEIKSCMVNNGFSDVGSQYYDEGSIMFGDLSLQVDSVIIYGRSYNLLSDEKKPGQSEIPLT
jgi:arsenite methyltransferase